MDSSCAPPQGTAGKFPVLEVHCPAASERPYDLNRTHWEEYRKAMDDQFIDLTFDPDAATIRVTNPRSPDAWAFSFRLRETGSAPVRLGSTTCSESVGTAAYILWTCVSAPATALLTCGEEGLLEGVWRQGGGVETGRQQGFDLGE